MFFKSRTKIVDNDNMEDGRLMRIKALQDPYVVQKDKGLMWPLLASVNNLKEIALNEFPARCHSF